MVKTFDLKIIQEKSQLAFFPTMAVVEILDHKQLAHFKPFLENLKYVQLIDGEIVVTGCARPTFMRQGMKEKRSPPTPPNTVGTSGMAPVDRIIRISTG